MRDSFNYRPEIRKLLLNHFLNLTILFPIYFSALGELHKVKYFGKRKFSQMEYSFWVEITPSDAQYQIRLVEFQLQYLYRFSLTTHGHKIYIYQIGNVHAPASIDSVVLLYSISV